jgi:hypothetical protein
MGDSFASRRMIAPVLILIFCWISMLGASGETALEGWIYQPPAMGSATG